MDHYGEDFKHYIRIFISFKIEAKIKQGIFVRPEIRKQLKDEDS